MFRSLMTSRRFAPLFWCQFFSAFNDNFLKNTLVFLILFRLGDAPTRRRRWSRWRAPSSWRPSSCSRRSAARSADRFDKALVAAAPETRRDRRGRPSRCAGFWLHSVPVLFVCARSCFGISRRCSGRSNTASCPTTSTREELPAGNALVEGGDLPRDPRSAPSPAASPPATAATRASFGALMMAFAVLCWLVEPLHPAHRRGRARPRHRPEHPPLDRATCCATCEPTAALARRAHDRRWFWLVGAVVLSLLPTLVKNALGGNESVVTALLAVFAVGIAIGSGLAAWLASGRIVLLPAPVGAALMALFGLDLAWAIWHAAPARRSRSASAPSSARLGHPRRHRLRRPRHRRRPLHRADLRRRAGLGAEDRRARVVAAVNVVNAGFMTWPARWSLAILRARASHAGAALLGLGRAEIVAASLIVRILPTNPFRDFLSILFRAFYRLEVKGIENLEKAGPNADHRPQPRQLPRRGRWRCRCSTRSRSSPSTTASPSAGG